MNNDKDETRTPPPMDDEEFDVWWSSLGYGDLDEFEREIEESISGYEILPDPNWEEKKRRIQETARRARSRAYPAGLTEEQQKKFPPGLLAYWRGEAPTPYDDPAAWDEFAKTLAPSDDFRGPVPRDKSADAEPQGQPDTAASRRRWLYFSLLRVDDRLPRIPAPGSDPQDQLDTDAAAADDA